MPSLDLSLSVAPAPPPRSAPAPQRPPAPDEPSPRKGFAETIADAADQRPPKPSTGIPLPSDRQKPAGDGKGDGKSRGESDPIACGLQGQAKGVGPLPTVPKNLPRPLPQQAGDEPQDEGAETAALPAESADADTAVTDMPAAICPPQPFAQLGWTPPPPPPPISMDALPVATGDGRKPGQPAAGLTATAQAPALPQGFSISPDMARQIAELIKPQSDETAPALAGNPDALAPGGQPIPQFAAPLHPAFAPAQRPAIDTSRAGWMEAMIDRIAEMPQADGKREAQLRLLPDRLGAIEVRIEQRQDQLHVTLNADNAQTRQLLADSTPKLHELAEARGLRLGQTGIGGGGERQDRRPAPDYQPAAPLAPPSAQREGEPESAGDLIA